MKQPVIYKAVFSPLAVTAFALLCSLLLLPSSSVQAACSAPVGEPGDILYNTDESIMQYCNDTDWIGFPKTDKTPDAFTFTDLTGQATGTLITSNIVTINGVDDTVNVSISGDGSPSFRINGGSWVTSGTLDDGDTLQLRLTSGGVGTMYSATVMVGTSSDQWDVSTPGADTTPNAFAFTDVTGQALSTVITSNSINISGINSSTPVSVSGSGSPQIRINGGSWVTSGNITNGQSLEVRLTSSASAGTMLSATVDVGGVTDQWDVSTAALEFAYHTTVTTVASRSSGSSYTFNNQPIGTASADRLVILITHSFDGAGIGSVTVGGVSAIMDADAGDTKVWSAIVPTGTTANVVLTVTSGTSSIGSAHIWTLKNYESRTPYDTGISILSGNGSSSTVQLNTPANGAAVFATVRAGTGSHIWTNATEVYDSNPDAISSAQITPTSAVTNLNVTVSYPSNVYRSMVGASYK